MKDFLGRTISVGDYIAYAVRAGNVGLLYLGLVVGIERGVGLRVRGWDEQGHRAKREARLQYADRVAVIPESQIPDNIKQGLQDEL